MTKEQENALKIINEQCPSMSNGEEVCLSPTLFLEMYSTLKRLQEQVKELKDKQFTYCAYCGHKFPIDGSDSVVLVEEHIATCEKHPVFKLRAEIERLTEDNEKKSEIINDYGAYMHKEAEQLSKHPKEREWCEDCTLPTEVERLQIIEAQYARTAVWAAMEWVAERKAIAAAVVEQADDEVKNDRAIQLVAEHGEELADRILAGEFAKGEIK